MDLDFPAGSNTDTNVATVIKSEATPTPKKPESVIPASSLRTWSIREVALLVIIILLFVLAIAFAINLIRTNNTQATTLNQTDNFTLDDQSDIFTE